MKVQSIQCFAKYSHGIREIQVSLYATCHLHFMKKKTTKKHTTQIVFFVCLHFFAFILISSLFFLIFVKSFTDFNKYIAYNRTLLSSSIEYTVEFGDSQFPAMWESDFNLNFTIIGQDLHSIQNSTVFYSPLYNTSSATLALLEDVIGPVGFQATCKIELSTNCSLESGKQNSTTDLWFGLSMLNVAIESNHPNLISSTLIADKNGVLHSGDTMSISVLLGATPDSVNIFSDCVVNGIEISSLLVQSSLNDVLIRNGSLGIEINPLVSIDSKNSALIINWVKVRRKKTNNCYSKKKKGE